MADVRISDLNQAGNLLDTDLLVGVNGGQTRRFALLDIAQYIQNKIVNGVVNSATTPTATTGRVWFNSTSKQLRVYDGSVWKWVGGDAVQTNLTYTAASQTVATADWDQISTLADVTTAVGITHSTNASSVIILEKGIYQVNYLTRWQYSEHGARGQGIHVASVDFQTDNQTSPTFVADLGAPTQPLSNGSSSTTSYHSSSRLLYLDVGNVVTPVVYQSSGSSLTLLRAEFSMNLIGYY